MSKITTCASVIPSAEPFLFLGDDTGILLVHGFTGAPKEMRTMGEYLAAHGKTVLGIRQPGQLGLRGWSPGCFAGSVGPQAEIRRCIHYPSIVVGVLDLVFICNNISY